MRQSGKANISWTMMGAEAQASKFAAAFLVPSGAVDWFGSALSLSHHCRVSHETALARIEAVSRRRNLDTIRKLQEILYKAAVTRGSNES